MGVACAINEATTDSHSESPSNINTFIYKYESIYTYVGSVTALGQDFYKIETRKLIS